MRVAKAANAARVAWLVVALGACSDTREPVGAAPEAATASPWRIIDAADFNGDGLFDAEWSDPTTGRVAVWLMRGTHLLEGGPAIHGPRGPGWAAVTAEDFNLDGMADVPWWSPDRKRAAVWLIRGTHLAEAGPEIPPPPGTGWVLAYAGDMDGDGMADLFWYDESHHRISVYLMRGTCVERAGSFHPGPPGDGWTIANIADFNLDGMGDVLWFNTNTHRIAVWLMAGTEVLEAGPEIPSPPGKDWAAITSSDFNRDGMNDVIWNDPVTNRMAVYLMAGTCLMEAGPAIPGPPGEGWSVGGAGDADGDGMGDAFWQNPTLRWMTVWTINGTHVVTRGPLLPIPE